MRLQTDPLVARAQPRGGAAGLRDRPDGARAADRRGAARPRPRRARRWSRDWIEEKAGADLDALGLALDDQAAFAALAGKLLRDLELVEGEPTPSSSPRRATKARARTKPRAATTRTSDEDEAGGRGEAEIRGEQRRSRRGCGESDWSEERDSDEGSDGMGDEGEEGMLPVRPNRPLSDLPPSFDYQAFTTPV